MDITHASPAHKLFLDYVFLNEISNHPEGISGYRIKKTINKKILAHLDEQGNIPPREFSQSLVYRVFKNLKTEGLINATQTTIKNRNQILYSLNEKGKKRLTSLKKVIQRIAPIEVDPSSIVADLISGKISPLEFLPPQMPEEQLLEMLKNMRTRLKRALADIAAKIKELEKKLTK